MKLLKKLYSINSPSQEEEEIREFIIKQVKKIAPNAKIEVDKTGNILVTKGKAKTYPCVVAHMDEVHERKKDEKVSIIQTPHIIYGWSELTNGFTGIGADDKNGCWINLQALKEVKAMKTAFFVGEEAGCIGSHAVDLAFFQDCRFIFQSDRRNGTDLIFNAAGVTLASDEFLKDLNYKAWGFTKTTGSLTDVMTLSDRQVGVATVNVSSGYYNPHTSSEYTKISELINTKEFIITNMMTLSKTYPHKATRSWGGFGYYTGNRWGHSIWNDSWDYPIYGAKKSSSTAVKDSQKDFGFDGKDTDLELEVVSDDEGKDFTVSEWDDGLDPADIELMKDIGVYDNSSGYIDLYDTVLEIIGDEEGAWMTLTTFLETLQQFIEETKVTRPDLVEAEVIDNCQRYKWFTLPSELDPCYNESPDNEDFSKEIEFVPDNHDLSVWRQTQPEEFKVPDDYNGIGDWAFYRTPFRKIILPKGLTRIGEGAFYECPRLELIYLPSTLQTIGVEAFFQCPKLKKIYIPPSVFSIGGRAFHNTDITIVCEKDSYAERYAKERGINFQTVHAMTREKS